MLGLREDLRWSTRACWQSEFHLFSCDVSGELILTDPPPFVLQYLNRSTPKMFSTVPIQTRNPSHSLSPRTQSMSLLLSLLSLTDLTKPKLLRARPFVLLTRSHRCSTTRTHGSNVIQIALVPPANQTSTIANPPPSPNRPERGPDLDLKHLNVSQAGLYNSESKLEHVPIRSFARPFLFASLFSREEFRLTDGGY